MTTTSTPENVYPAIVTVTSSPTASIDRPSLSRVTANVPAKETSGTVVVSDPSNVPDSFDSVSVSVATSSSSVRRASWPPPKRSLASVTVRIAASGVPLTAKAPVNSWSRSWIVTGVPDLKALPLPDRKVKNSSASVAEGKRIAIPSGNSAALSSYPPATVVGRT